MNCAQQARTDIVQQSLVSKRAYTRTNSISVFPKPYFRRAAETAILELCLNGKTQIPNESANYGIWSQLPDCMSEARTEWQVPSDNRLHDSLQTVKLSLRYLQYFIRKVCTNIVNLTGAAIGQYY